MSDLELEAAVERVLKFLTHCGDADIEAGVGYILGNGSEQEIAQFKRGIRNAIRIPGQQMKEG